MSPKLPALIPDRNSASGFRIEYLSVEIDAELAQRLTTEDETPDAKRMRRLAYEIRGADMERLAQITFGDKELILKALNIAADIL